MIRAVIRNGQIHPIDPLPAGWTDRREVIVEEADAPSCGNLEVWYRELQELGPARYEPGEWERVQATLADAGEQVNAVVRRQMGRPR